MQQLLISLCWRNQSISVLLFASNTRLLPRGLRWLCLWVDEFWGAASKSFWLYFIKIWFTASKNFWRHQFSCLVIGQYRTTLSLLIHRQIASSCAWRTRHIVIAVYICFSGAEVVIFAYWRYTLIGIRPCGLVIHASNDTRQMFFLWFYYVFLKQRSARAARGKFSLWTIFALRNILAYWDPSLTPSHTRLKPYTANTIWRVFKKFWNGRDQTLTRFLHALASPHGFCIFGRQHLAPDQHCGSRWVMSFNGFF